MGGVEDVKGSGAASAVGTVEVRGAGGCCGVASEPVGTDGE